MNVREHSSTAYEKSSSYFVQCFAHSLVPGRPTLGLPGRITVLRPPIQRLTQEVRQKRDSESIAATGRGTSDQEKSGVVVNRRARIKQQRRKYVVGAYKCTHQ